MIEVTVTTLVLREKVIMNGSDLRCWRATCNLGVGLAVSLICSFLCVAQTEQMTARELVDLAMKAQIAAQNDASRFEYQQQQLGKSDTRTYRVIESDAGAIQRTTAINDQELTPMQREHEEQWLQRVLTDPSIQKNRTKDDAEEEARRQKIIAVLGRAFLYEIEGTENEGQDVRLHFRPNPQFHSDSREAQVCAGLEGTMWIDQSKYRFTRAEGNLVRGVDFEGASLGTSTRAGTLQSSRRKLVQACGASRTWR